MPDKIVEKLKLMSFPYTFNEHNPEFAQLFKLITWLEDTQIRLLTEADRRPLKTFTGPETWWKTFQKYCQDLGYRKPISFPRVDNGVIKPDGNFRMVIEWIVAKSIRLFYTDNDGVYKYGQAHEQFIKTHEPKVSGTAASKGPSKLPPAVDGGFTVNDPAALKAQVDHLCQILQLKSTNNLSADLSAVSRTVKQMSGGGKISNEVTDTNVLLQNFPLGFTTLDPKLDSACKVLRILYTADLRDLQDRIDQALIALQNITGDPKTDARLGQVGR